MTPKAVTAFNGSYRFLSNFYPCRVFFDGMPFRNSEAAFQAAKTMDLDERQVIQNADDAKEAKRLGRTFELRPDWEDVKFEMMWQVLISKFTNITLATQLTNTGSKILVEGNTWHDQIWGDCRCDKHNDTKGLNILGRQLMLLRRELVQDRTGQSASRPWLNRKWK